MLKKIILTIIFTLNINLLIFSQTFNPLTQLYEHETKYFRFIFTLSSTNTLVFLLENADNMYEELSSIFCYSNDKKLEVVLTTHNHDFNGYFSSFYGPHIVLYDTPFPLSFTKADNPIYMLFLHELVHYFSLTMKSPFLDFLNNIFGFIYPAGLNTLPYMLEGVTVAFESRNGYGRANDPFYKQLIQQDIYENKFKTLVQISDNYDIRQGYSLKYIYGGQFSYYLINRYGLSNYANLWKEISKFDLKFFPDKFKKVYNITLDKAYAEFKNYITFKKDLIENTNYFIKEKYNLNYCDLFFSDNKGNIYFYDSKQLALYKINSSQKINKFMNLNNNIESVSVSKDGNRVLLNLYKTENKLTKTELYELNLKTKSISPLNVKGILQVSYYSNGYIGLEAEGMNTRLVYVEKDNKNKKLLLNGDNNFYFNNPIEYDNKIILNSVYFGRNYILIFDPINNTLSYPDIDFNYIRNISIYSNRIYFDFNNGGFYKCAYIENNKIFYITNDFSGGVFKPIPYFDKLIYLSIFSEYNSLLYFSKADIEKYFITNEFEYKIFNTDKYYTQNENTSSSEKIPEKIKFNYYNPFKSLISHGIFIPLVNIIDDPSFFLIDKIGFQILKGTPDDQFNIDLKLQYNHILQFIDINAILNINFLNGDWNVNISDNSYYVEGVYYRLTDLRLLNDNYIYFLPMNNYLRIAYGIRGILFAFDPYYLQRLDMYINNVFLPSAYLWNYKSFDLIFEGLIGFGDFNKSKDYKSYKGYKINIINSFAFFTNVYKIEFNALFSIVEPVVNLTIEGAYSKENIITYNGFNNIFGNNYYKPSYEFMSVQFYNNYLLTAKLETLLSQFEIQDDLLGIYFRRFLTYFVLNSLYTKNLFLYSAYLKLRLETSISPSFFNINLNPYFHYGYTSALTNTFFYLGFDYGY